MNSLTSMVEENNPAYKGVNSCIGEPRENYRGGNLGMGTLLAA